MEVPSSMFIFRLLTELNLFNFLKSIVGFEYLKWII